MFGWLQDLINAISKAISEAFSGIGQEITSSIWTTMLTWFYDTIYGACADFFSMMGNMGAEIFDLKWVQATVYLFTLFGWGLFVAGIIVSVFDFAIEYQNGRGNIKNTMLNILKGYLKCEDIEQDAEEAESYLRRASEHGNKYASYALAKAYLDGELFGKNIPEAIKHLTDSADKGFAQAEYLLGKLLYRGEIIEKDVGKALEYLERAIGKGNSYAAYLAGTILLTEDGFKDAELAKRYFEIAAEQGNSYAEYQLGKMYLFGKATEKDFEKAMEYLKFSAEHGNKYAEQLYQNAHSNRNWAAGMGAFRLFHHLARLIQNKIDDEKKGKFSLADRKLRRMINEKKEAQGLRLE